MDLAVPVRLDALDLPDRHLDAGVLDLLDRGADEGGAEVGVVAGAVAAELGELLLGRRDQQLEEEVGLAPCQVVGEGPQALQLAAVQLPSPSAL